MSKLKRKLETAQTQTAPSSKRARIPRDLSVSHSDYFIFSSYTANDTLQEAVKTLHDRSSESERFEGAERYIAL